MYVYLGQKVLAIRPWANVGLNYGMTGTERGFEENGDIVIWWDQIRREIIHPSFHQDQWFK